MQIFGSKTPGTSFEHFRARVIGRFMLYHSKRHIDVSPERLGLLEPYEEVASTEASILDLWSPVLDARLVVAVVC